MNKIFKKLITVVENVKKKPQRTMLEFKENLKKTYKS